jgi:hypothetical protein
MHSDLKLKIPFENCMNEKRPVLRIIFFTDIGYNVCFIKIHTKLSSVLLLCLVRIFMKQALRDSFLKIRSHQQSQQK